MTTKQPRVHAGVPSGGQFSAPRRDEPDAPLLRSSDIHPDLVQVLAEVTVRRSMELRGESSWQPDTPGSFRLYGSSVGWAEVAALAIDPDEDFSVKSSLVYDATANMYGYSAERCDRAVADAMARLPRPRRWTATQYDWAARVLVERALVAKRESAAMGEANEEAYHEGRWLALSEGVSMLLAGDAPESTRDAITDLVQAAGADASPAEVFVGARALSLSR
jgi:hypothetical protein